jgi:hypothetical protein
VVAPLNTGPPAVKTTADRLANREFNEIADKLQCDSRSEETGNLQHATAG